MVDKLRSQSTFIRNTFVDKAPVVRKVDNAVDQINHYPVDKCCQNKKQVYPLDSELSGG